MTILQFNEIFQQYRMFVFYFLRKQLVLKEDAEEITANAFIKLWKAHDKVDVNKTKAFLMITARHLLIDLKRYKSHRPEGSYDFSYNEYDVEDTEESDISSEVLEFVLRTINDLHPQEQKIIKMRFLQGMKTRTISEELGITMQTVNNTVSNGLKHIRKNYVERFFKMNNYSK